MRVEHMPEGLGRWVRRANVLDAVDLALGTPGLPLAGSDVVEGAVDAVRAGENQYGLPAGNIDLRLLVSRMHPGRPDPEDEVTTTVGATEALAATLLALVDPGDEVVVLRPYYPAFLAAIALVEARSRFVTLHGPPWALPHDELLAAFTSRTRAVIVNSPHNPTGWVLSRPDLDTLGYLCLTHGAWLITDEVYSDFTYDGHPQPSAFAEPELRPLTVSIGSFSKTHAVSGWRVGYVCAAPAGTRAIRLAHEALTGGGPAPLQRALLRTDPAERDATREAMRMRRDEALEIFRHSGFSCATPSGGCYFTVEVPPGFTDETLTAALLDRAGVFVLPGRLFGGQQGDGVGFVRVAFNRQPATLDLARRRLEACRIDAAAPEAVPDRMAS